MSDISERMHKTYYDFYSRFDVRHRISAAGATYMNVPIYIQSGEPRESPKLAWIINPEDFRQLAEDMQSLLRPLQPPEQLK